MEVSYCIFDPTGNITALCISEVDKKNYRSAADRIMQLHPAVEQVGFLSADPSADGVLCMTGGEFCGNASISAASYFYHLTGKKDLTLLVSGADSPVRCSLCKEEGPEKWTVSMPLPSSIEKETVKGMPAAAVVFPGVTHIVVSGQPFDGAETEIRKMAEQRNADCLGLIFFDEKEKRICPLVYVRTADTMFWETACASGTSAVGCALAAERGCSVSEKIRQPGGVIDVCAGSVDGRIRHLSISGFVSSSFSTKSTNFLSNPF